MPNVFKRGRIWYARFKNTEGNWQKEAGFTDKSETMRLATKREHEADLVRKGLADAPQPKSEKVLEEDFADFRSSLLNKEVSEDQVDLVEGRCKKLCKGCGFVRIGDIEPVAVESWLAKQRKTKAGKIKKKGMSVQTSNHYLRAIKQFTRWGAKQKRIRENKLLHLEMLNVAVDRRHDRRALSVKEMDLILKAAREGGSVLGMAGVDRHMLYVMSMSTGLRASELASLRKESLSLDTNPPTVKVKAGYSKRRRLDILPLPEDILEAAREWLAGKTGLLWPGNWAKNRVAGKMLQVDLKAVGIPYQDRDGLFADFHALRHTFITNLGLNGVPLVTTQKLARHSTPVLTVKYTHIGMEDQHREVQKLPGLNLGRNLGQTGGVSCPKVAPNGTPEPPQPNGKVGHDKTKKPVKHRLSLRFTSGRRGIRTPVTLAGEPVFKTGVNIDANNLTSMCCGQNGTCSEARFGTKPCQCMAVNDANFHELATLWGGLSPDAKKKIIKLAHADKAGI